MVRGGNANKRIGKASKKYIKENGYIDLKKVKLRK